MRVLNGALIEELLTPKLAYRLADEAMRAHNTPRGCVNPLRHVLRLGNDRGLMGMMPAWAAKPDRFGIKLVNIFPENTKQGLSSHLGLMNLFDGETGRPLAILDASILTGIRTAAVSAVATDALAKREADVLGIIGTGEQAMRHIDAIAAIRKIGKVLIAGRTFEGGAVFVEALADRYPFPLVVAGAEEVATSADILCTVTSSKEPVITTDWLKPGQHINAVGASRPNAMEITPTHLWACRVFVDSKESFRAESGELKASIDMGSPEPHLAGTLGELLTGAVAGRLQPEDVTLYRSFGLAIQDLTFASRLYDMAAEQDLGQVVDF